MSKKIDELLTRAVEQVVDKKSLRKRLGSGRSLRIKLGIDPTADMIHLGNAVVLWKLREFQDLGHKAVLIIGDFTGRIGDPSDKKALRKSLSPAQIKKNMRGYLLQASRILNLKKLEVRYNSEWLSKLRLSDFITLAQKTTVDQLLERDIFEKRRAAKKPLFLHEILYPVLQAYDSVATKADVELGGTDQTFNLLFGRDLMGKLGMAPQEILTCPLLLGLDGKEKMSKSLGNFIGVLEKPFEMYGKIMSLPDALIPQYAELAARLNKREIGKLKIRLKKENPRNLKMELAKKIVALYQGAPRAERAEREFILVFQKKKLPTKIRGFAVSARSLTPLSLLDQSNLVKSRNEARRLLKQKAIRIDGKLITDPYQSVTIKVGSVIQVGKRRFARVRRR